MRKPKQENIGSDAPATKGDIEQLREDMHADIVEHTVSKQEFEKGMSAVDKRFDGIDKRFDGVDKRFDGIEDRIANRVLNELKAYLEQRETDLQGKHEDELDIVAGEKETPPQWKTVPRRLKTVETQVEKIKDHLAIA